MLTSLAAVLVLLAVGFYTLSVGATGRAGAGEGTALSSRTRALVLLLSMASLGGAYMLYRKPLEPAPEPAAVEATAPTLPVAGRSETPKTELAAEPAVEVPAAEVPAAAKPDAPAPMPTPVAEESLSSAALALETEGQSPRPATVLEPEPVTERRLVETPAIARPEKSAAAPAPRSAKPVKTAKPKQSQPVMLSSKPHEPVMLHVQNLLGPTQAREQLTLSIEGRPVANLAVDGRRPGVEVAVPLPRGGLLRYRLEGLSDDGSSTTLAGEGCIRVQGEARFDVRRRPGSQKVFLEASTGPAG